MSLPYLPNTRQARNYWSKLHVVWKGCKWSNKPTTKMSLNIKIFILISATKTPPSSVKEHVHVYLCLKCMTHILQHKLLPTVVLNRSLSQNTGTELNVVESLACRSLWPWRPSANWQSWGFMLRKVGLPSKGNTQEPFALRNGSWPLGEIAPVSVSSRTESLMWLIIWWFSSRSCSSCWMRFCNTEIWLWNGEVRPKHVTYHQNAHISYRKSWDQKCLVYITI